MNVLHRIAIDFQTHWKISEIFPRFLIVVILALGLFFRFANLDQKVYSNDEVITLLRAAGYNKTELLSQAFNGNEIGIDTLQKYQHPNPEKGVIDTIKSVALDDVHPPLYFLMVRFWVDWFDNSVAARNLSALISLLVLPLVYWLCLELFNSPLIGWIAIALIAVSPLHIINAQNARSYSLLTVAVLLSSLTLLRAIRLKTKLAWGMYAVALILGFYSHLYFVLTAIGQAIYVIVIERFRLTKTLAAYLLASLGGLLIFAPWLFVLMINWGKIKTISTWTHTFDASLLNRLETLIVNLSRVFLDLNYNFVSKNSVPYLILILVGYSIYFLCRHTPKQTWLFILTLIGVTALALIIPDLIWGGRRSIVPRYLTPSYLGIQLSIAYLLTTQISAISASFRRRRLWQLLTMVALSAGVISCVAISQARGWWTQGLSPNNLQVAPIINQASRPLVISDGDEDLVISLTYLLDQKVRLLLLNPSIWNQAEVSLKVPQIPERFSEVFLYYPSQNLRNQLEKTQTYKVEILVEEAKKRRVWLCKLSKKNQDGI